MNEGNNEEQDTYSYSSFQCILLLSLSFLLSVFICFFYSWVNQGSLYFDCNPNGTWELAGRQVEEKENDRQRHRIKWQRQKWGWMERKTRKVWKQSDEKETDQTVWKAPERLKIEYLCVHGCVSAGRNGLPITLSLCEVTFLWLWAREDSYNQKEW